MKLNCQLKNIDKSVTWYLKGRKWLNEESNAFKYNNGVINVSGAVQFAHAFHKVVYTYK